MTILIHFHQSHHWNFKAYYTDYVLERLQSEFPSLASYTRFVGYIPSALLPLCVYLRTHCLGLCTGIAYIDATSLSVCKNPRILTQLLLSIPIPICADNNVGSRTFEGHGKGNIRFILKNEVIDPQPATRLDLQHGQVSFPGRRPTHRWSRWRTDV